MDLSAPLILFCCTEIEDDLRNQIFSEAYLMLLINPLNAELNPICHLLALLGAYPILHVSRIRVKESSDWN
jgi:hypothetical protein